MCKMSLLCYLFQPKYSYQQRRLNRCSWGAWKITQIIFTEHKYACVCAHACSVMSSSFETQGLQHFRLLFPWNFPVKNAEVGFHFLLQEIFRTQGLNSHLLHCQTDSLPLSHLGNLSVCTSIFSWLLFELKSWVDLKIFFLKCHRKKSPAQIGCMRQALGPGALGGPGGSGWRGRWEGGSGWGRHVNSRPFHFNV